MIYQSRLSSRFKYNLLITILVFFSLFLSPDNGICRTPVDLAQTIQSFNHSDTLEEQLDLSYLGLDLYAPIADKSSVDPKDRVSLSKMKRLVLISAISKAGGNVLIAGIGSTGNWVAKRPGKIVNDYPAGNQDAIVQLKLKGCYMEGLSDLDFVIMGQGARDYQNKIYRIFAEGRGDTHLTPEEMDELEINFITDEQIKSLAAGPEGRKFWKQLMDLSNSSAHAEKYITKGGKALYGMDHLYENGAVITLDKQNPAKVFADYAKRNGHKMGPFSLLHLFGGSCDMDYFIAHATQKVQQEKVKTVLQIIKYLKRDAWMLNRAAKNLARLPKELPQRRETTEILKNYAADISKFTDQAIKSKVWRSAQATAQFGEKALDLSGLVCSAAHEMLIKTGDDLLVLRAQGKLTATSSAILASLVYDLETVEKKRYQRKHPKWYAPEYSILPDKPRDETLYFLKRYREGKKKDDDFGPVISREELKKNEEMELGPILPPPVATIEVTETTVSPKKPTAGAPVTITISGKLNGVADELPDFSKNEYSDKEKQDLMKELAEWSLNASFYRMQIRYLMDHEGLNSQKKSVTDKVYVSPYDIEALAEDLEFAEDVIASLSRQLNGVVVEKKREYDFHVRSTPSAQSIDDYLSVLEGSCKQGLAFVEKTQTIATAFSKYYDNYISNTESDETNKKFEELSKSATNVKTALNTSLGVVSGLLKKRSQLKDLVEKKDPKKAAELLQELETKLAEMAKAMNSSLVKAEILNADLMVYGAKTHQLLTKLGDTENAQNARKKGEALLAKWGARQLEINKKAIPDLKRRKLWLKAGGWAAKGARWGVEGYAGYLDYKKNVKKLSTTDLGGGAEDAVLALTVAGQAMEKLIGIIPIPVLENCLKGYAKILSDSAKWAVAIDSAQAKMYQDLGFDIRSNFIPAAYGSILKKYSNDAKPALFFNRMRMPLAEYNGLIVMATPDQDMKWLVWSKHKENGYILIDKETHRKISLYSAWYRRVHGENISGEMLHDLLTKGSAEFGLVFKGKITVSDLKFKAKKRLEHKALKAYFASMTSKRSLKEAELANYRAMLFQAASQYAEQGFLMTDADIKEIMQAVIVEEPIPGSWQTAYNLVTLTPGNADRINQEYLAWDKLYGKEKGRLEAVLKKQIQAKVDRRTKAREKNWKEAKLGGDDGKAIAAGLLFSEVGIVLNHALFSKEDEIYADDFIDLDNESFTISWKTTIPDGVDLTQATYVGIVEIAGYPSTRIQIATPIETNKNEILEEMIALAEEAEELGNSGWSSCQQAVAAFTPFEEKLDEIKSLVSELQIKSNALKSLNFKVEAIPGKLSHKLSEAKKLAKAIEKYLEKINELSNEICKFGGTLTSSERGEQISLMAQIHSPLAQLKKKSQSLNSHYDKAQKELVDWDQFNSTLEELDALLIDAKGWTEPLLEEFAASVESLAVAEKHKQKMSSIKAKADRLLREGEKVYSSPESSATLEEINVAHGRVLHPLNELTSCLELAADKKTTAVPLGNKLSGRLPQAEKVLATATKTKERLDAKENTIENLSEELSTLVGETNEQVLQAERAMGQAQLCYNQSAEPDKSIPVPDLLGKTLANARRKLADLGLNAVPSGGQPAPKKSLAFQVASQEPEAGTLAVAGESVSIIIYSNYLGISVPNVTGLSVKDAKEKLQSAELSPKLAGGDPAPQKKLAYTVQSQWPEADDKVAAGSTVKLKVYGAVQYKSVPSIIGMTTAQAKSTLTTAGLKPSLSGGNAAPNKTLSYKIATQSPDPGTKVIMGSVVSAHVYGNFDKEAAIAQSNCDNFPGALIKWDDAKDKAMCFCPSGQVWSKERNSCISDPKIAERKRNRQQFWNAVISTAVPIIVNEIASGGSSSSGGTSGSGGRSNNNSNTKANTSSGSHSSTANTQSSGGDPKQCELKYCPSCADAGVDLFGVAVNSQCTDCRKEKGAQIDSCIRGEKSGQGTKYVPKDYIVMCDDNGCSIVKTSAPRKGQWKILFGPDSWSNCHDAHPNIY